MYEKIKKIITSKNKDIDKTTLKYFCNYFEVVASKNIIPEGMTIDELIDNVLRIGKIEFFKDDDAITKDYGDDFKGKRDSKKGILYIRESLPEELKEITTYHEIHHAAQTGKNMLENENCGINQEENLGRLIMEAQTQWFAEEVYKSIHNISFNEKNIPSEQLRMEPGQTICSSLHNYEMYDALLSKLAIIMSVPKEYFVTINYMYENNKGMQKLQKDYNKAIEKKKIPIDFDTMMQIFDYAYVVDYIGYINTEDKDLVLKGQETHNSYIIHKNWWQKISQHTQASYIRDFDNKIIITLMNNANDLNSDFVKYSKYIFDNKNRKVIENYIANNIKNNQEKIPIQK